ncbi:hypothetical protein [Bartonella phoceensis]|uniref:hypothetical protein n=1 Tax=Bartonella phoceensis TaxID=270249 RepID=UPI001ABADF18|nr:hypothetical protein [Bartonella phoceensis]
MKKNEVKILRSSILGACFVLTGCSLSAPSYGTDKPVSLQFFEDIANITSLTSKNNNSQLVMKPHPKLVIPKFSSRMVLPLPQQDNSSNEVEASKQHPRDGRVVVFPKKISSANEYANTAGSKSVSRLKAKQRQEYLRRQRAQVGSAQYRRYLTEPPLSYRQPAKIAPISKKDSGR